MDTDYVYDFDRIRMASRERLSKPQLPDNTWTVTSALCQEDEPIAGSDDTSLSTASELTCNDGWTCYGYHTTMLVMWTMGGGKLKPAEVMKLWRTDRRFTLLLSASDRTLYWWWLQCPWHLLTVVWVRGWRDHDTLTCFFSFLENWRYSPVALGYRWSWRTGRYDTAALCSNNNVLKPLMDACYDWRRYWWVLMRRIQVALRTAKR